MISSRQTKTAKQDKEAEALYDSLRLKFESFIKKRGLRRTAERFAILERACRLKAHFDIEDLLNIMENEGYHVSRSTVYNTINLLCDCGILQRLLFSTSEAHYELATPTCHLHLVCTQCGSIREMENDEAFAQLEKMKLPRFYPTALTATVHGLCSRCHRKNRKK